MTSNLDEIEHKVEDETHAIMLLNAISIKYKEVKTNITYGWENLAFNLVSNLRANDLEIKVFFKGNNNDSLI